MVGGPRVLAGRAEARTGEVEAEGAALVVDVLGLEAREEAERVLEADPDLEADEHAGIRRVVQARYSRAVELFRVG